MDTENLIKQLNILFVSNHIDRYAFELLRGIADKDHALQLQQTGVSGRSEQLCGNLDENYNCKNTCLTRCVNGKKFYK